MIIGFEFKDKIFTQSTEDEITNLLTFRDSNHIVIICQNENIRDIICNKILEMNENNGTDYATSNDESVEIDELYKLYFTNKIVFTTEQDIIITTDKAYGFYEIHNPQELWFASESKENTITIYAYTDFMDYEKYWNEGKTLEMLKEGRFI